jgi:hypothetical protein
MTEKTIDSLPEGNADRRIKWFEQHPLVSTLLWMMGAELNNNMNENMDKTKRSETLQETYEPTTNPLESQVKSQAKSQGKHEKRADTVDDLSFMGRDNTESVISKNEVEEDKENGNTSPSWGFYVAITPEQQEMYAKALRSSPNW